MNSSSPLFTVAAKKALKIRIQATSLERPCDVYESIVRQSLVLQFFAVRSLEGVYLEDGNNRRICVSALRPARRQRFTAAHELGHAVLGHGTKLDSVEEFRANPIEREMDEKVADTFAVALLMPSAAVHAGFALRKMNPRDPSPVETYTVATWLGVGYTTLLRHLCYSMKVLGEHKMKALLMYEPKTIKSALIKQATTKEVFNLDQFWNGQVIHATTGDFLSGVSAAGNAPIRRVRESLFVAAEPGEATVALASGGTITLKIARENYVGFYDYRYLPEEN